MQILKALFKDIITQRSSKTQNKKKVYEERKWESLEFNHSLFYRETLIFYRLIIN